MRRFVIFYFSVLLVHCGGGLCAQDPADLLDPAQEFRNLTAGRPVWVRSEIKEEWMRAGFDNIARQLRISNGRITQEQYVAFVRQQTAHDTAADRMSFSMQININDPPPPGLDEWEHGPPARPDQGDTRNRGRARAQLLRPDLPSSIAGLDTNRDGQIAFVEWKSSGRPLGDFARMDRNNDGLITAEEAHRLLGPDENARGRSR